ncbi:two-partner secretion domain-containing protein [Psittacicella hinzii]|nr:filamentous hemagglutinin N-terminal domain-containing protein [Psittacicella hinzii]
MNRIYKLVYSKTLNSLVAVSENAKSHTANSSVNKDAHVSAADKSDAQKSFGNIFLGAMLLAGAPVVASANTAPKDAQTPNQPVATQNLHTGIEVDAASAAQGLNVKDMNGTALINIVNPNAAGVSDNRFKSFSTSKGAVFNNNADALIAVESKVLGERIAANPNLKAQAKVILAQVTGNDKSVIQGALEVLGGRADLMIINPKGIDLNGIKVINVNDFTASTAEVGANNAQRLLVRGGEINVNEDLSTDDVNVIRLIAQAVKVKATIAPSKSSSGKRAKIVVSAGNQEYDVKTDTAKALNEPNLETPEVAISGSRLGSMYGDKVKFIVSGSGAGVEYDGLVMGDDNVEITADGQIKVNKVGSVAGDVNIDAGSHKVEVGTAKASSKLSSSDTASKYSKGSVTTEVTAKTQATSPSTVETTVTTETAVSSADVATDTTKQKFVTGQNVNIKGGNVAAENALVSAKEKVAVTTTSRGADAQDFTSTASTFSGHEVELTFDKGSLDKDSKVLADNVKIKAERTASVDGLVYADNADISANKVNADSKVEIKGKVVANNATASASNVELNGAKVVAGSLTLDGKKVGLKDANVTTNTLSTTVQDTLDNFTVENSTVNTPKFNLDGQNVTLDTQAKFDHVKQVLDQITATDKNLAVDNVYIDENTTVKNFTVGQFTVRESVKNFGILNLSQRALSSKATTDADGTTTVLNVGKTFENYGLLLADTLGVKAGEKIKLDGATFIYNNLTLISPEVDQEGDLTVSGNLNALTDTYKVASKVDGDVKVGSGTPTISSHYADWRARRDYYEVYTEIGVLDGSDITVSGGQISVKGDFTIVPLAGSDYAKGTLSEGKTYTDVKDLNRLDATNADIYVGGNLALDGNLSNKVQAFTASIADLLKIKGQRIQVRFKPTTWIKTDLMRLKIQEFDSLYDLFQGLFGNGKFDWHNGAYKIQGQYVLDTLSQNLNDSYTNKIFSVVFGSDWRNKDFNSMKAAWNKFIANPNDYQVALWAPGAQIVTGGSIDQINGSIDMGVDTDVNKTVLTDAEGKNYALKVESALVADSTKLKRNYSLSTTLDSLSGLGVISLNTNTGKYESSYYIPYLGNVANFSLFTPSTVGDNLLVDNQTAAQLVLEQVKSQTGTYYFSTNTDANIVNGLLSNTVSFNKKLASYQETLTNQIAQANGNATLIKTYTEQFNTKVARLKATTDYIEFVKAEGSDAYVPVVRFSSSTLDKSATLGASAAVLNAGQAIRIHNADSVKSNYGTISADTVAIVANTIDLKTNGVQNAIIANKSGLSAKDFSLQGSAAFGDLSLQADNASFESVAVLNDEGDLVQVGRASTEASKLEIAEDLTMKGFTYVATGDAEFNVGGNLDLLSKYEVASRFSQQVLENTLGSTSLHEAAYTVKGSTIVGDTNVTVNTGGDLTLESSRLAADQNLDVTVEGDLDSSSKVNVYDATSKTSKLDLYIGGKVQFGSASAEGRALASSTGIATESSTDTNALVTKSGQPVAQAGFGFSYTSSTDKVTEVKTANSAFDSSDLNVKVAGNADLSNTDINEAAQAIAESRAEQTGAEVQTPKASIEAGSVTTDDQGVDIAYREHEETTVGAGINAYVKGSAFDVASHVVSAARAKSNGEELDPTLLLTAVGDATGLQTRDLVSAGVRANIGVSQTKANEQVTADNRNTYAGDVSIKSDSDISLKAVDATKVGNLTLEAQDTVSLEGGKKETTSNETSWQVGASIDAQVGASRNGAAASVSASLGGGGQFSNGYSLEHQNTDIDADSVTIKAQNVDLTSTTVDAKVVDVEAQNLTVTSEQDKKDQVTNGFSVGVTGGASINTQTFLTAFGSGSVGYNHHKVDNDVVTEQSGITATESLTVDVDSATLTGGKLVASEDANGTAATANVNIDNLTATDIKDTRYSDGGSVGLSVGVNKYGSVTVDLSGGRDKQDHYSATTHATVAGEGVDLINTAVTGDVNTDAAKAVEVHEDRQVQDTAFGITLNEQVIDDVKKAGEAVVDTVNKVKETVVDAVKTIQDGLSEATTSVSYETTTTVNTNGRYVIRDGVAYPVYTTGTSVTGNANNVIVDGVSTTSDGWVITSDGTTYKLADGYTVGTSGVTYTKGSYSSTTTSGSYYGSTTSTADSSTKVTTVGTCYDKCSATVYEIIAAQNSQTSQTSTTWSSSTTTTTTGYTSGTFSGSSTLAGSGSTLYGVGTSSSSHTGNTYSGSTSPTTVTFAGSTGSSTGASYTGTGSTGSYTGTFTGSSSSTGTSYTGSSSSSSTYTGSSSSTYTGYTGSTGSTTTTGSTGTTLTPSHLELTEMNSKDNLENQYLGFNENGSDVNRDLSGSYSEIFGGKVGSATPGQGGGLTDVQSAEKLLEAKTDFSFSNYDKEEKELVSRITELDKERVDLEKQLANAPKDSDLAKQIETRITEIETETTEATVRIEVIKENKETTTIKEHDAREYVTHTFPTTNVTVETNDGKETTIVFEKPEIDPPLTINDTPEVVDHPKEFELPKGDVKVDENDNTKIIKTDDKPSVDPNDPNATPTTPTPIVPDLTNDPDADNVEKEKVSDKVPAADPDNAKSDEQPETPVTPVTPDQPNTDGEGEKDNNPPPTTGDDTIPKGDNNTPKDDKPTEDKGAQTDGSEETPKGDKPTTDDKGTQTDGSEETPKDDKPSTDNEPKDNTPTTDDKGTQTDKPSTGGNTDDDKPSTGDNTDGDKPSTDDNTDKPTDPSDDKGTNTDTDTDTDTTIVNPSNPSIPSVDQPTTLATPTDLEKLREEVRDEFRHYEETRIPTLIDPDINFHEDTFAWMEDYDGSNVVNPGVNQGGTRVTFASAQPKAPKAPVASTAPAKPRKVTFASSHRPVVTPVVAKAVKPTPVKPTPVVAAAAEAPKKAAKVSFASANPVSANLVNDIDDTIDALACINPLVGKLNVKIDNFRGDALVINRSLSLQPNFENVKAAIGTYADVFGVGKTYTNTDDLRVDLGYRTVADQQESERQDTLKRKQIEFASAQLQNVAVELDKLRVRAVQLRETAKNSDGSDIAALTAELDQIKQQELSLTKQYKDLRAAIYSLTEGYNFGFTIGNDKNSLAGLLENLAVVSNGQAARNGSDIFVTIQNLDTYLYGTQATKYSNVHQVKRVVTFDNYAENSADYNDDKKLYIQTQESIAVNAKNLRMRVANLHLELKALSDDYKNIVAKVSTLTNANEKAQFVQKQEFIKSKVQSIISQINSVNLASNVDLVKTMTQVSTIENQLLEVRNQVSYMLGGKAAAVRIASAAKLVLAQNASMLEDQQKAQAIVNQIANGQTLAGGVKVYNPQDTDVLSKTEVQVVNNANDLRQRARQARTAQANNTSNDNNQTSGKK